MTTIQKIIKYLAIAFAIFLIVNIISAIFIGLYCVGKITGLNHNDENIIMQDLKQISTEITEISTLKIELGYTNLQIKSGEKFKVETNNSKISFSENNGRVVIEEKRHNWFPSTNNQNSNLVIYLPEDMQTLNEIKLEAGAGEVTIESIETKNLHFELGAGKVHIQNLIATEEAKIDGGAGKIDILSGEINNLDFDMGVGEANLQAKIIGKSDIDAGVGSLNIKLKGQKEDYRIKAEKGLGNIQIDSENITGDDQSFGHGENYIKIDGGVGNITVSFEQ